MGFLDNAKKSSQEVKEAVNNKAQEYANLAAQIENLASSMSDLKNTVNDFKNNVIEARKDMTEIKTLGDTVVKPIRLNIKSITEELTKVENAVQIAAKKIKDTEYSNINWQGRFIYALFTAILMFMFICSIQYYIFDIEGIKNDIAFIKNRTVIIHYNQTTGSEYGQYDPWHLSEFFDKYFEVNEQQNKQ